MAQRAERVAERDGAPSRAGRSRQQVGRWLNGKTQPRLDDFLCLIEAITGRVCDLVAALVPIEKVPSVEPAYRERLAARQLAHEEPWTEAILRCLQKLEQAGVIKRRGAHYQREDIERIRRLVLATYREIRAIVEHTESEQAVALVNLQLVNFESP